MLFAPLRYLGENLPLEPPQNITAACAAETDPTTCILGQCFSTPVSLGQRGQVLTFCDGTVIAAEAVSGRGYVDGRTVILNAMGRAVFIGRFKDGRPSGFCWKIDYTYGTAMVGVVDEQTGNK